MKRLSITLTLSLFLSGLAFGQDRYLGVSTRPVDPALASHLNIPRGFGLTVHAIAPQTQAEGVLKPHDILLKFNQQHLISPQQLTVLVRTVPAGKSVSIELIRNGKKITVPVGLSQRPTEDVPPAPHAKPAHAFGLPHIDDAAMQADVMRMLNDSLDQTNLSKEEIQRLIQKQSNRSQGSRSHSSSSSSRSHTLIDNGTRIHFSSTNGKAHLTVRDPEGKITFDGPLNTTADLDRIPDSIRIKLQHMERAMGVPLPASSTQGTKK